MKVMTAHLKKKLKIIIIKYPINLHPAPNPKGCFFRRKWDWERKCEREREREYFIICRIQGQKCSI